jgi:hypothetical protein
MCFDAGTDSDSSLEAAATVGSFPSVATGVLMLVVVYSALRLRVWSLLRLLVFRGGCRCSGAAVNALM